MNRTVLVFIAVSALAFLLVIIYRGRPATGRQPAGFKRTDSRSSQTFIEPEPGYPAIYAQLKTELNTADADKLSTLEETVNAYNLYIDSLKADFQAKLADGAGPEAVRRYFKANNNGEEIFLRRTETAGIMYYAALTDSVRLVVSTLTNANSGKPFTDAAEFARLYFDHTTPVAASSQLQFFHHDVHLAELAILKDYSKLAEIKK